VIRYPEKIPAGKVIRTAQCNIDFTPMALNMMGITNGLPKFHGKDTSPDFLGSEKELAGDRIVYLTNAASKWVAAVSRRYKLVLSVADDPWLFDLKNDPDELINFYENPEYKQIAEKFQAELIAQMEHYKEPALENRNLIYETGGAKAEAKLGSSEGYVVDSAGHSVKGKAGQWARAITVPPGTFEPNSSYDLEVEWESKGLEEGADFFANFIDEKNKKKNKQTETWKGAAGETGVVRKTLKTTSSNEWTLHVGVRDGGELLVKRIRIKKK
jgi:hypothetical protein